MFEVYQQEPQRTVNWYTGVPCPPCPSRVMSLVNFRKEEQTPMTLPPGCTRNKFHHIRVWVSLLKRIAWSLAWSRKKCLIQKLIFKRKVLHQICPFIFTIFVVLSRGHIEHFFCPSFVWVWFFEAAPFMLDSTSFRSLRGPGFQNYWYNWQLT